ncbi:pathogenicity locus [bacterium]|nr:pathogenicity locus [bacterium]
MKALQALPGIGPAMSLDLWHLGFTQPADLRGADPQAMYDTMREETGGHLDRCVLYVFRCAVYHAETATPDPALHDWWKHMG